MSIYNESNKYQDYINKINDKYDSNNYNIQHIRILKNSFNEQTFVLKTKFRLNKRFLIEMFHTLDPIFDIIEISESWLGEKMLNEDNINDGILQWFVKLKNKINFKTLDYIGGNQIEDSNFPTLVNFISPSITPPHLIRYDHLNNKYKVPIFVVINNKLHDKIWYESEKSDVFIDEIYIYAKYYINHFLENKNGNKHKNKNKTRDYFIKNIVLTNDGWYLNITIV